jgi:hypothetical protein
MGEDFLLQAATTVVWRWPSTADRMFAGAEAAVSPAADPDDRRAAGRQAHRDAAQAAGQRHVQTHAEGGAERRRRAVGAGNGNIMLTTLTQVEAIVRRYVDAWDRNQENRPLWVVLASPGDAIQIPGVTFGKAGEARAGMELPISAHLIVLNQAMIPDGLLKTFLHEYGHTIYRQSHQKDWDEIESEAYAIQYCINALSNEGLEELAYSEADAVMKMASSEPYRSAVARLQTHAIWLRYARPTK